MDVDYNRLKETLRLTISEKDENEDQIRRGALYWLLELRYPSLDPQESRAQFTQWILRSPQHVKHFWVMSAAIPKRRTMEPTRCSH